MIQLAPKGFIIEDLYSARLKCSSNTKGKSMVIISELMNRPNSRHCKKENPSRLQNSLILFKIEAGRK
jgi:hypothetical protein